MTPQGQSKSERRATFLRLEGILKRLSERHERTAEAMKAHANSEENEHDSLVFQTLAEHEEQNANTLKAALDSGGSALDVEFQYTPQQTKLLDTSFSMERSAADAQAALIENLRSLADHFRSLAAKTSFDGVNRLLQSLVGHYTKMTRRMAAMFTAERSL